MHLPARGRRWEAERRIKALAEELEAKTGVNDALKSEMAMLEEDVSKARDDAQRTIDSQHDEMTRMEQVNLLLRAEIESKRKKKDVALATGTEEKDALCTKVEALSREISRLRNRHDEQVKVVESLSLADEREEMGERTDSGSQQLEEAMPSQERLPSSILAAGGSAGSGC